MYSERLKKNRELTLGKFIVLIAHIIGERIPNEIRDERNAPGRISNEVI